MQDFNEEEEESEPAANLVCKTAPSFCRKKQTVNDEIVEMAPNKLREIIVARVLAGERKSDIARAMKIHSNTVYNAWRDYQVRGTTDKSPMSGRPISEDRKVIEESVRTRVEEDPNVSIRALSRELNVPDRTMRRILKSLGLKSLAVVRVQQLTPDQRRKRLEMSKVMLNRIKKSHKPLVFCDEKDFHLNKHLNCRNCRTIAPDVKSVDPVNRYQGRPKFPKKAMFFGYVSSGSTTFPSIWIEGTVDAPKYKQMLVRHVLPTLERTYGKNNFIWIQDGAPCHTAKTVLSYLESKLGSKGFWSKGTWPPNSCNLNPLDYSIWSHVDSKANNVYHANITAMKAAVDHEWNTMSGDYVRATCAKFRSRLAACIKAEGGVFEKKK